MTKYRRGDSGGSGASVDFDFDPDPMQLCEDVATACQVMAECGLVEHVLGHISVRVSADELLVRCRGPRESGLAYTTADDIRLVTLDGQPSLGDWTAPNELPIHTEVMRQRPGVTAVVHAHPPSVVAASLADVPIVPTYGAYDIPGARLAADGVATWDCSALIANRELAEQMVAALGDAPVVVLRGHGLVSVAGGEPRTAVARAVLQAIAVDSIARMSLTVLAAGGTLQPISDEDLAALPDLGGGFNVDTMWRHLVRRTAGARMRLTHQAVCGFSE
jgi:ribulose-5-phosphate 4-epimerase/fuculose-1-phosphate aldolase